MSNHAVLAASAAPIWGHCSGSVSAQLGEVDIPTTASRVGTATHWAALDCCIRNGRRDASVTIGTADPDGTVITAEMAEGAQVMVDEVLGVVDANPTGVLFVEQRVHMTRIHREHNWGTLDAALYVESERTLYVWDYKNGHSIVEAEGNLQLVDYAEGIVGLLRPEGDINIVFRIVQPFAYRREGPVVEWRTTFHALWGTFDMLKAQADEALGPNPTLTVGKHCRHCKAIRKCAAAKESAYTRIDRVKAAYTMEDMQGTDLAAEMRLLQDGKVLIAARLGAIEEELKHRVKNGDASTGLTLETSYGKKKWNVPAEQAIALAKQFGADISKTVALTPAQAAMVVPKEMQPHFNEVLKAVAPRQAKGLTLVNAEDSISYRAFNKRV